MERPEETVWRLQRRMDELYRDLMRHVQKHGREDKLCKHVTLRPPHLPCPHPECYTPPPGGRILAVASLPDAPVRFWEPLDEHEAPAVTTEFWQTSRLTLDGAETWGWRRVG